ncbi:unnamed protein product [Musa hybrid cultivar]
MGRADCIKSIRIRAGGVVDSIAFTYVIGETTKQTHPYGGPGGTSNEIKISDEEYLTSISGYIGECGGTPCISQLTFATNQENYGPYGSGGGTPFNLPVEEGKIARFYGRAGPYLTAIGVYLKPN